MADAIRYTPERQLDKSLILRLADLSFVQRGENLLLTGATGCGKSYLATAFGYQACLKGLRVGYFALPKLIQTLHLARADGSFVKELARLERLHVLILDDWGLAPLDMEAKLALLQIMEDRYGRHSTIITSQLPIAQWYDYLAEPTIADAFLDRLLHQAHRIELKAAVARVSLSENKQKEKKNQYSLYLCILLLALIHSGLFWPECVAFDYRNIYSTSADVTASLQKLTNAVFIGEESGGTAEGNTSGLNALIKLPNSDLGLKINMYGYWNALPIGGKNRGTLPDYALETRIADILQGQDRQWSYALFLARNAIKR